MIVWEYNSKMKVLYKHKMVYHEKKVNHITIEEDLRVVVSGGEEGMVVIANLFSGNLIRILKFEEGIKWAMCLSYPYTMMVLQAG